MTDMDISTPCLLHQLSRSASQNALFPADCLLLTAANRSAAHAAVSTRSAAGCMGVSLPANGSPPSCIQYRLGLLCPALPLCHAAHLRSGNSVQSGTGGCSLLAIAASGASCSSHSQACRAKHAGTSAAPAANWRTGLAATSASLANPTHSFRMHPLL